MIETEIPYEPRPVQREIHAAVEQHRFSVIIAHRRLGKTVAMVNHLIKQALLCPLSRPHCAYIAPLYNQAKSVAWHYVKEFSAVIPGSKHNESELYVEFPNGGRVRLFGADNPDSLRGNYFDTLVLDEVADMKPELWGEVLYPALVDRHGSVVFIGTPKGINLLYEIYTQGLQRPDWHCAVYRVTDTDVIPPHEIVEIKESMSEPQFRQEFMCDFMASAENILIPLDLVQRAKDAQPSSELWAPIVMGVDVAREGDDESVCYVRQGLNTIGIHRFRILDLMALADQVSRLMDQYQPAMTFVDSVGIGAGLVDRLRQMGKSVAESNAGSMPLNKKYANRRAEMWVAMRDWLDMGGQIPNDYRLMTDLTSVTYLHNVRDQLQLEKKADMKKRGLSSPDSADALAMTFSNVNQFFGSVDVMAFPDNLREAA
jgi:hypothetical protein